MIKKVNVQAIVQARFGSARLPGKVFSEVGGKSLLGWVINRLRETKSVERIIIATGASKENDGIEKFALDEGVEPFRGSEEDVLDRFVKAAKEYPASAIVRATADNPLLDSSTLDSMIKDHIENRADHTTVSGRVPLGTAAEVVSPSALEKAWEQTNEKPFREHVTTYIHSHPELFRIVKTEPHGYLKGREYRFTVDTKEDLELMRTIYGRLDEMKKKFNAENAVLLADQTPELLEINRSVRLKDWRSEF